MCPSQINLLGLYPKHLIFFLCLCLFCLNSKDQFSINVKPIKIWYHWSKIICFLPYPSTFFKNKINHVLRDFAPGRIFNSLVETVSIVKLKLLYRSHCLSSKCVYLAKTIKMSITHDFNLFLIFMLNYIKTICS